MREKRDLRTQSRRACPELVERGRLKKAQDADHPLTRSVLPFDEVLGMQNSHHRETAKHATGPNAHEKLKDPATRMRTGSSSHYIEHGHQQSPQDSAGGR